MERQPRPLDTQTRAQIRPACAALLWPLASDPNPLLTRKRPHPRRGAVALGALLSPGFQALRKEAEAAGAPLRTVAAISCGGNVDVDRLAELTAPV